MMQAVHAELRGATEAAREYDRYGLNCIARLYERGDRLKAKMLMNRDSSPKMTPSNLRREKNDELVG